MVPNRKHSGALVNKPSRKQSIALLYADEQYAVFDKPSGLLVIPSPKGESRTLVNLVNGQYAKPQEAKFYPCHRIDRDTSGAILFARGKRNQQAMMDLFKARAVDKTYIAFVHGHLRPSIGEFRRPVGRPGAKPSPAHTNYRVIEHRKGFSVVEVKPVTGRTNQIRIHFAQAKHPLVGERKFAFARDYDLKFRRTALHAACLAFKHPVSGKLIIVEAPLAEDMKRFLTVG